MKLILVKLILKWYDLCLYVSIQNFEHKSYLKLLKHITNSELKSVFDYSLT